MRNELDQPLLMCYCNVGEVVAVGDGFTGFAVGDSAASNGKHAEFVAMQLNLCAKVPDTVADESAVFTVLGSIALQGIFLVQPTLGETGVVTGLGLIGLATVQLLKTPGLPSAGPGLRQQQAGSGAPLRRRGGRPENCSLPSSCGYGLFARARRGRGHRHRQHQEQRAHSSGRADVPQARPHRATYHVVKFARYGYRDLAEVQFRFNRRYDMRAMLGCLLKALVATPRQPEKGNTAAEVHR